MNLYIVTLRGEQHPTDVIADDFFRDNRFFIFFKEIKLNNQIDQQTIAVFNTDDVIKIIKAERTD